LTRGSERSGDIGQADRLSDVAGCSSHAVNQFQSPAIPPSRRRRIAVTAVAELIADVARDSGIHQDFPVVREARRDWARALRRRAIGCRLRTCEQITLASRVVRSLLHRGDIAVMRAVARCRWTPLWAAYPWLLDDAKPSPSRRARFRQDVDCRLKRRSALSP